VTTGGIGETDGLGWGLYDAGWKQGAVFDGPGLAFGSNRVRRETDSVELHRRNVQSREQLVVVSQDCDIVSNDEPFVEALICSRTTSERAHRLDRNSARWFVINPDSGLVAEARYRLPITKDALARFAPQPWPGTIIRFRRFVRWLGRRYDRPALPDLVVELFQRPITALFERLDDERPNIVYAFSMAVHEIRATIPPTETPPFEIHLMLMARRDQLTEEEDRALQYVEQELRAVLDPAHVQLGTIAVRLEEEMSVAEYFATRPVFLEYLTYRGEESEGAEPLTEQ
jgi:hypothetical protein